MDHIPKDPIERMIRHTEEFTRRQIERELSFDGIQRRLSQLADALYLGMIVVTPLVCFYDLGTLTSKRHEPRVWQQQDYTQRNDYGVTRR